MFNQKAHDKLCPTQGMNPAWCMCPAILDARHDQDNVILDETMAFADKNPMCEDECLACDKCVRHLTFLSAHAIVLSVVQTLRGEQS